MTKNKSVNFLLQMLGCFISAAGIYSFAVASEVPVTGVAGICAILYRLFGIPMGLSNVLINIPIILCTYKLLGKSFFIRSVYCMVLFAVFTDYLLPLMPVYQGDRLLATICGGVVGGILTGLFCVPELSWTDFGGLLYTGDPTLLIAQIEGILITIVFVAVMSVIIGLVVKVLFKGSLRVSAEEEAEGLDAREHGESAYPAFNGLD